MSVPVGFQPAPHLNAFIIVRLQDGRFAPIKWTAERPRRDDLDNMIRLTSQTFSGETKTVFSAAERALRIRAFDDDVKQDCCVEGLAIEGTLRKPHVILTHPWGSSQEFPTLAESLTNGALFDTRALKIWTPVTQKK